VLCQGGIHLLHLFPPLLLPRPVSTALLLHLFVEFGGGLFLLPFVVVVVVASGLPLWVGAFGLNIGEF